MLNINKKRVINDKFYTERLQELINTELLLLKQSIKKTTKSILDLGSGDGRIGFMITDMLEHSVNEIYLTDYNEEYIQTIKNNVQANESNIKVKKEDVLKLSFEDAYFDLVIAFGDVFSLIYDDSYGGIPNNCLNDQYNWHRAILESRRVLKPGGHLLFSINPIRTPSFRNLFKALDFLEETCNLKIIEVRICNVPSIDYIDICGDKRILLACEKKE